TKKQSNQEKLRSTKSNDQPSPDKACTGDYSRWIETDRKRQRIITYPKNYEADHICYDGHSFYVIEGNIQVVLGEEITEWQENDDFIIPVNVHNHVFNPFVFVAKVVFNYTI